LLYFLLFSKHNNIINWRHYNFVKNFRNLKLEYSIVNEFYTKEKFEKCDLKLVEHSQFKSSISTLEMRFIYHV